MSVRWSTSRVSSIKEPTARTDPFQNHSISGLSGHITAQAYATAFATAMHSLSSSASFFRSVLLISSCTACVHWPPALLTLICVMVRRSPGQAPVSAFCGLTFRETPGRASANVFLNAARRASVSPRPASCIAWRPTTRCEPRSPAGSLQPWRSTCRHRWFWPMRRLISRILRAQGAFLRSTSRLKLGSWLPGSGTPLRL
mmetsp:Transcript_103960/g.294041  ORF Transcript_103960/g.294041 Transcript_103960/m.294041 type:complete len:200 (-) Transcript_103960:1353-1952(-)